MNLEIITRADLNDLKQRIVMEVVDELKKMLAGTIEPEYIKSKDVKKMLGCSDSKSFAVQKLDRSGTKETELGSVPWKR